jgi:hypothetical protein
MIPIQGEVSVAWEEASVENQTSFHAAPEITSQAAAASPGMVDQEVQAVDVNPIPVVNLETSGMKMTMEQDHLLQVVDGTMVEAAVVHPASQDIITRGGMAVNEE